MRNARTTSPAAAVNVAIKCGVTCPMGRLSGREADLPCWLKLGYRSIVQSSAEEAVHSRVALDGATPRRLPVCLDPLLLVMPNKGGGVKKDAE